MNEYELILGNLIRYRDEKDCIVSSLGANGFETVNTYNGLPNGSSDLWEYNPIPLTEEWLVRFGFEKKYAYSLNRWIYNDFEIEIQGEYFAKVIWSESCPNTTHFIGHCKHVHQLQNLYFALTGEELKLNDK